MGFGAAAWGARGLHACECVRECRRVCVQTEPRAAPCTVQGREVTRGHEALQGTKPRKPSGSPFPVPPAQEAEGSSINN